MKEKIFDKEVEKENSSKMKIPKDMQKEMLEFFLNTSIPRKKAKENHLSNTDR